MTAYIRAGRLDKRLALYTYNPLAERNVAGGLMPAKDSTYTYVGTIWAAIEARPGSERLTDKRIQAQQTHEIVTRSNSMVSALRERDRGIFQPRVGPARKYDVISQLDQDEDGRLTRISVQFRREPQDV